ncbi:MAG TPA: hypothetical protein VFP10_11530 [Candidatus Eisenbacteria bacterium]|nr:hypothetical protein [Candidatus Eisenbacteria bacterium]
MSSTDQERITAFFEQHWVPAGQALRQRGVRFFPSGPEPEAETWYMPAPMGDPLVSIDPDVCRAALRELWQSQRLPELVALVGPLLELGKHLEVHAQDTADISPFTYVMY